MSPSSQDLTADKVKENNRLHSSEVGETEGDVHSESEKGRMDGESARKLVTRREMNVAEFEFSFFLRSDASSGCVLRPRSQAGRPEGSSSFGGKRLPRMVCLVTRIWERRARYCLTDLFPSYRLVIAAAPPPSKSQLNLSPDLNQAPADKNTETEEEKRAEKAPGVFEKTLNDLEKMVDKAVDRLTGQKNKRDESDEGERKGKESKLWKDGASGAGGADVGGK